MLRTVLLWIGAALLLLSATLLAKGEPGGGPMALLGLTLTAGILAERVVYKHLHRDRPGAGWAETGERFVDPASGRIVTVFHHEATGERRYVEDQG